MEKSYNYFFTSLPKKVGLKYYANIRDDISNYFACFKDVISVYEYGSVNAPGVSDLDLIIVLKDRTTTSEKSLSLKNISKDAHQLVIDGTVMMMNEAIFSKIQRFDYLTLKKLYGKDIVTVLISETEKKYISLVSLIDWLPERILRLTKVIKTQTINVNNTLCLLNSYSYSIKNTYNLLGESKTSLDLIRDILLLRSSWYEVTDPENLLIACVKKAIDVGYARMQDLSEYMIQSQRYIKQKMYSHTYIDLELYSRSYLRFYNEDVSDLSEKALSLSDKNTFYVLTPMVFYPHFMLLSSFDGQLSSNMRKRIKPYVKIDVEFDSNYKYTLKNKMLLAEQNASFLKSNNYSRGLIRYGFYFK